MKRPRHWTYHEEKIRKAVLVRDNYECQIRGANCTVVATTVDHIHPKAWGGLAVPDNLRAACKPCNQRKGARAALPEPRPFFKPLRSQESALRKISLQNSRWTPKVADYTRKAPE